MPIDDAAVPVAIPPPAAATEAAASPPPPAPWMTVAPPPPRRGEPGGGRYRRTPEENRAAAPSSPAAAVLRAPPPPPPRPSPGVVVEDPTVTAKYGDEEDADNVGFGLARGTTNTYVIPNMEEMSPEEYREKLQETISARQVSVRHTTPAGRGGGGGGGGGAE